MTYLFSALAVLSLIGVFIQSLRKNGHGMVYACIMVVVWLAAAQWSAGGF